MRIPPSPVRTLAVPAALSLALAAMASPPLQASPGGSQTPPVRTTPPPTSPTPPTPLRAERAAQPVADLALRGPIRLGNRSVEWGNIVELDAGSATRNEAGHCRFNYRYAISNEGPGSAGAHVNRLVLENGQQLAEDTVEALDAGQSRMMSGSLALWGGEHVVYVELDADEQVNDRDRSNNRRRIRADVSEDCVDPRPRARPPGSGPGSGNPIPIPPPPGTHRPPDPPRSGSRAAPPERPPQTGHRAAPPQGRPPVPGTQSKPIPDDARDCRPRLSATRTTAVTRVGAQTTAVAAWEAAALARYGAGFRWSDAEDQNTECSRNVTWTCTASARPCKD